MARARLYETELTPGDLVYIPPGWWHYVEALEGNASVLLPFDMSVAEQQSLPRRGRRRSGARASGSADEAAAAKATGTAPAPAAADEKEVVEEMDDASSFALDELDYASDDADGDAAARSRRSRIVMRCATRRRLGATRRRSPRLYPR